eukprot:NODE_1522_length_868_cov_216.716728_g1181_i0.p1 GENE.NODE_1522_length_868_cov_216.716728_g1181_i0~~NODE_1522_length_868_cov_216.716728_g1181_i0.p1  ORF type:complete len:205 (-),score=35.79 NODE_1522_length_868_cov_216.716728_g1181_i0:160-774(-)
MGKEHSKDAKADVDCSKEAKKEVLEKLQKETNFSIEQITKLHETFKSISARRVDDGVISKAEFFEVLEVQTQNALLDRMFELFDSNGGGTIDFREFLAGVSILSNVSSRKEKLNFCFRMYDLDGNGTITQDELLKIVEAVLLHNSLSISKEHVVALVSATFEAADLDKDGHITEAEFEKYVINHPQIIDQLTINSQTLSDLGGH